MGQFPDIESFIQLHGQFSFCLTKTLEPTLFGAFRGYNQSKLYQNHSREF